MNDALLPAAPLPKTWWVKPGHFLAGPYPYDLVLEEGRRKLTTLLDAGIRTWISLQGPGDKGTRGTPFADYEPIVRNLAGAGRDDLSFQRFAIADMEVCPAATTVRILDAIDDSLQRERPVYLHCWGGHGRTGTIVGCWLVRHGLTGDEALRRIVALRSGDPYLRGEPSPQTPGQRERILAWATLDPRRSLGDGLPDPATPSG